MGPLRTALFLTLLVSLALLTMATLKFLERVQAEPFDESVVAQQQGVRVVAVIQGSPNLGDGDSDGVLDPQDNCAGVPNGPAQASVPGVGNQTNTDADNQAAGFRMGIGSPPPILAGDSLGDACDPDDDNDGFSDADERAIYIIGAGSTQERTPCRTATVSDPWPPDIFGSGGLPDRVVDGQDLVAVLPGLFKGVGQPGYSIRLDLFQPGTVIDGQDLVAILPFLFKGCQSP